ncbi:hypothetical protein FACS189472_13530 [Alphaproteobacteria bacterium]|nr:hypothetical protein FACS189472_13530 [Alphaproteobacteria bacterium]
MYAEIDGENFTANDENKKDLSLEAHAAEVENTFRHCPPVTVHDEESLERFIQNVTA